MKTKKIALSYNLLIYKLRYKLKLRFAIMMRTNSIIACFKLCSVKVLHYSEII